MDLKKALEQHKEHLDKSEIVVVTSDNVVYLLKKVSEIDKIKEHAEANKLQFLVLKNTLAKTEVKTEVKVEKPYHKKGKVKK